MDATTLFSFARNFVVLRLFFCSLLRNDNDACVGCCRLDQRGCSELFRCFTRTFFVDFAQHLGCASREVHTEPTFACRFVELVFGGEVVNRRVDVATSSKFRCVAVENDFVFAFGSEEAIVGE